MSGRAPLDLLTFGEALVEVMRVETGVMLDVTGTFTGPYPSGAPFIFAMQAARLGVRVGAIGGVGADVFGRFLNDRLEADGVDTAHLHTIPGWTTGVAFVAYRHDGTRDFLYHIAHAAAGQIDATMLNPSAFEGLKCLHIMGSTLSMHADALAMGMRALEMARAAGAKISFDPNLRPQLMSVETARLAFYPVLLAADVLLPTVEEIRLLTGEVTLVGAIAALLRPGRVIVVTEGAAGCAVFTTDHPEGVHVPGFAVEEVDPTGAGDCFDAGFLVRWLEGADPVEAARFANACGALAVTRRGPAEGAMPRHVVEQFLRDQSS